MTDTTSTKERLIHRLQWYFQVEGINVLMFFGIMLFLNSQYAMVHIIALSYGILFMCYILVQGTYYWWIKWRMLKRESLLQHKILSQFQSFKTHNQIGLVLMPVIFLLQYLLSGQEISGKNLPRWALAANLFAVAEYINYYHWQLMHDNIYDLKYLFRNRSLKRASLAKDLREEQF